jgi:hypothetical protein
MENTACFRERRNEIVIVMIVTKIIIITTIEIIE